TIGSNDIYIGNVGAASESSTIRLGTTVTHTACFVAGIKDAIINKNLVYIDPATGQLGIGNSNYTFSSNVYICNGTLFVNQINPCSPTTTTTFGGSINLPNTTTANIGSLQINGARFLSNFGS